MALSSLMALVHSHSIHVNFNLKLFILWKTQWFLKFCFILLLFIYLFIFQCNGKSNGFVFLLPAFVCNIRRDQFLIASQYATPSISILLRIRIRIISLGFWLVKNKATLVKEVLGFLMFMSCTSANVLFEFSLSSISTSWKK